MNYLVSPMEMKNSNEYVIDNLSRLDSNKTNRGEAVEIHRFFVF